MAEDDQPIIQPHLVNTEARLHPDRRLLIFVIVLPYVVCCAAILSSVFFTQMDQGRITLAASTVLAPLGTLAGGICAYYFKSG